MKTARTVRYLLIGSGIALLFAVISGCGSGGTSETPSHAGPLHVVAAENFWGSIAAQLGGNNVQVTSIITNPGTDPHDYEAKPADARAVSSADYVLYNGFGYDPWANRLLASNKPPRRIDISVQQILGLKADDNPHRWYSPSDVMKLIDRITSDYKTMDPANAANYDRLRADFLTNGLKQYQSSIMQIKERYAGVPVGATESIAAPLVDDLGLRMMTPPAFLVAMSEGNDPTAQDKATFDSQIANRQIQVLFFNTQNATPDIQRLVDAAKTKGIPIVSITETLDPATASFQDWQTRQLQDLAAALARTTGK